MTPGKKKSFQQRREELLRSRLVKDICPGCGNTNIPPGSKFCSECGSPLGETAPRDDTKTSSTRTKHAGEAIDLGLPSGTKWASCNVGATKPEDWTSGGNNDSWCVPLEEIEREPVSPFILLTMAKKLKKSLVT